VARKRIDLGPAVDTEIAARMTRGESAESIAKALCSKGVEGASRASIGRRMRVLRGASRASRPLVRPAPRCKVQAPESYEAKRDALYRAVDDASDDESQRRAEVALLRFEEPEVDAYLARGADLVDAITSAGHGLTLSVLRRPEDLAQLVRYQADGNRERAIALLSAALHIANAAP
jgi:hypothetical protein